MRIEEVEAMAIRTIGFPRASELFDVIEQAIAALRAEAWHPIEKAEELGAKDGQQVLGARQINPMHFELYACRWYNGSGEWRDRAWPCDPTHFRFINPPEEA